MSQPGIEEAERPVSPPVDEELFSDILWDFHENYHLCSKDSDGTEETSCTHKMISSRYTAAMGRMGQSEIPLATGEIENDGSAGRKRVIQTHVGFVGSRSLQ